MATYLTVEDLKANIYEDIINEIVRDNVALIDKCINAAVAEAKSYLSRYDVDLLFSDAVTDENLKSKVCDIAAFKLVKLSNPNIDLQLFKTLNDDAIKWLKEVRDEECDPQGWPYKQDDPSTSFNENFGISSFSNKRREQHF